MSLCENILYRKHISRDFYFSQLDIEKIFNSKKDDKKYRKAMHLKITNV